MVFRFIRAYRKRQRLRRLARILPPFLRDSFGGGDYYTQGQVARCIADLQLPRSLYVFAFSIALQQEHFDELFSQTHDYFELRVEMAEALVLVSPNFTILTLLIRTPKSASANALDSMGAAAGNGSL